MTRWYDCEPDCDAWDTLDFWWNEMVVDAYSWLLPGEWGVILTLGGTLLLAGLAAVVFVGAVFDNGGPR